MVVVSVVEPFVNHDLVDGKVLLTMHCRTAFAAGLDVSMVFAQDDKVGGQVSAKDAVGGSQHVSVVDQAAAAKGFPLPTVVIVICTTIAVVRTRI